MRVVLHPEANQEFTAAAQYYENQRPGLGAEFIAAVDEAVAGLLEFPHRWRIIDDEVRRGLVQRFPYAFYYWEKLPGEEIELLSLVHTKRHPDYGIHRK